ncbi:dynamin family protein [Paenibacillus sp. GSMTC-2017]|uniref:dynamin family protein n=1 Tax=Paenibacillus sp. GSMTC-2017 TaxID=2794350 RepID=UPI0018D70BDE|nr:dynamin family protein [Paenibacillus sp. GSMTC-2017]MBH5317891.1 dynamin family protein [Paenibacillus sp. GSMTC-2017]
MTQITVQSIAESLQSTAAAMAEAGDHTRAKQALELNSKLTEGRLTVALCGHFSAGKSTLVNKLCGAKLLPSSPIPTSANVVAIRGGERAYASVEIVKDGVSEQAEVPIEELDKYCVDGEQFASVAIVYPSELLGDHTVLLDTPGIDSTDDAHRMATESALHLADVVFYVMDYNHVQSEINFAFAKELKDWGKPLYFIVNQIDKHRDRELSFTSYRTSVEEAFQAWHLEPAGIVYLSLREPTHPHHEWEKLIGLIGELGEQREELCSYSVDASHRHLISTHLKWYDDQTEPERDRLLVQAGGEEAAAIVTSEIERLTQSIKSLANVRELYRTEHRKDLQSLLDNANITPAALRDLAHSFIESRMPGFKTGLLFAGAKTAAEQERRLEAFRTELISLINAAIDWHVKQFLRNAAERIHFDNESLEKKLSEGLSWQPDAKWLISRIKTGAVMGNEYTMTYSKELAADVKGIYRTRALELIDEFTQHYSVSSLAASKEAEEQLAALQQQADAIQAISAIEANNRTHELALNKILPEQISKPSLPVPKISEATVTDSEVTHPFTGLKESEVEQLLSDSRNVRRQTDVNEGQLGMSKQIVGSSKKSALSNQREAAFKLLKAAELLAPISSLRSAATTVRDKGNRLQSSQFTIALFGAFSAGKSSLANALIGDAVLPVSPNPTTAAINRLMPPSEEYGHGTARVIMKTSEAVISDLRYSLSLLGENASESKLPDAASILRSIDKLKPESIGSGGRPHYSFLRAARAGWAQHEALLGKELKVERDEYAKYVAEESRSCFVSEIDFHYDCELTAEGIVLVDTPGADSVNARHTGVAFNYIKNADAVLFVTYYNHAFSQADRQFLDQLGRVKDQFELDKMFFIVNAADLAADEAELQGVLKHVETNLLQHSIRSPRLFPVSSIQALDGKLDGNTSLLEQSRMEDFEHSFLSFIQNDLGRMAIESAEIELKRTIDIVAGWLRSSEGDATAKEAELKKLLIAAEGAKQPIEELRRSVLTEGLKQEIKELLYYVIQRLQYRFGEFYHLAFNPATLQDDGRDLKRVIWTAWLELQRLMQRELSQELLATTLRMERAMHESIKKVYNQSCDRVQKTIEEYSTLPYEAGNISVPNESADWVEEGIEAKWLWSRFKSPRQFFEGEGKTVLRKDLESLLAPSLQGWMNEVLRNWNAHYEQAWTIAADAASNRLYEDIRSFTEGKQNSLTDGADLGELKKLHYELTHLG